MKQYHIYHATGANKFNPVEDQPRSYVGFVQAESVEDAFMKSQNLEGDWNTVNPCRSTSVGDIILDNDDFYMVLGSGFKLLEYEEEKELSYEEQHEIDMMIAQNMLDNPENYGLI